MKYILILLISFAFAQDCKHKTLISMGDGIGTCVKCGKGIIYNKKLFERPLHLISFGFAQETKINILDSLPPLNMYNVITVDEKEIKIIKNTNDSRWKKYPDLKTKIIMTAQSDDSWGISSRMQIIPHGKIDTVGVWYLNYKEYWNDMLLCEPYPNQKLHITGSGDHLFKK